MKRTIITVFVLFSSFLCAFSQGRYKELEEQEAYIIEQFDNIEGEYVFTDDGVAIQKVITGNGNKNQLYDKVLEFLARTYKDSKEVVQVSERESGLIIAKGLYSFYVKDMKGGYGKSVQNNIYHIIKAECKDGRVRLTLTVDYIDEFREATPAIGSNYPAKPASTTREYIPDLYKDYKLEPVKVTTEDVMTVWSRQSQVYGGYQIYHCIRYLLFITDEIEASLNKQSVLDTSDDW